MTSGIAQPSAAPGETRPLRRDAARNRERILEAARAVFAERGVAATLDDVADRAGVGVGTVYRRYPNKDALLDELFEERIADLGALAHAAAHDEDAWAALVAFVERLAELFAADRALAHLVLHDDRGREHLARARTLLEEPVAALVERARAGGRLRADFSPTDIGAIHRMLAALVEQTHEVAPDLWRRYLVLFVDGMASSRGEPTPTTVAPLARPLAR